MRVQGIKIEMLARAVFVAAALLITGCSHQPPGSPLFEEGYTAGCSDGSFDAGGPSDQVQYIRDDTLFRTKPDYKNGWQQGYAKCYRDSTEYPEMSNRG